MTAPFPISVTNHTDEAQLVRLLTDPFFRSLVEGSAVGLCVFLGSDLVIHGANTAIKQFIGKGQQIEGRRLADVMPELEDENQPFIQILQGVLRTGQPFDAKAVEVLIERNGVMTKNYFDVHFSPVNNEAGQTIGVLDISTDVTAQVLTRQRMEANEQALRRLADAMPQLVWIADPVGNVSFYNQRIQEFAGAVKKLDGGWEWKGMLHPDDRPLTDEKWKVAVEAGSPYEAAHRIMMKDGQYRWFLSRGLPQKDEQGMVISWFGTATDVHDQKVLSEQILESEKRFRKLAHTLPQLIWLSDDVGNVLFASDKWEEYSGKNDPGAVWQENVHPDDRTRTEQLFANSKAFGVSFKAELRLQNAEGDYRWHTSVAEPVKDADGRVVQWVGALTDVHDQRNQAQKLEQLVQERTAELQQKNQELENTESFLSQIIDSSVEFITVVDRDLCYITVNRRFEQAMGHTRKTIKGQSLLELNPSVKGTAFYMGLQQALRGETVFLDKRPSHNRQGQFVETYFVPMRIQGRVEGVIIMTRDVTDIVRSNLMLERQNKELERSNGDLQQFAHVASHDLKEPVRKIRTFSERLQIELTNQGVSGKPADFLRKIDAAAERMFSMIEGVLQYSHVEASQEPWKAVSIADILQQVQVDFELVIQQKQARIELGELPMVQGAHLQLHQLFYNLVNNALKFSKQDHPPVITVQSRPIKGTDLPSGLKLPTAQIYHQIILTDNGIGFPQDRADAIFGTFTRLHPKDQFEGTGLGLALCKKIAERHGGAIYARGHDGRGASFFVVLPASKA